jgi:hypothetical protein
MAIRRRRNMRIAFEGTVSAAVLPMLKAVFISSALSASRGSIVEVADIEEVVAGTLVRRGPQLKRRKES